MISCNIPSFETDLNEVVKLFGADLSVLVTVREGNTTYETELLCGNHRAVCVDEKETAPTVLVRMRKMKWRVKSRLYFFLSELFNRTVPWGSLTGIRPVALYRGISAEGDNADEVFTELFGVSEEKTTLARRTAAAQADVISKYKDGVALYVNIPFCKGRCSYCSFFSADIEKHAGLAEHYAKALTKEISGTVVLLEKRSLPIRAVYVGGGTPSSLPVPLLQGILEPLACLKTDEFTVEAGRPDSITAPLLDMLQGMNVTRISINPQTSNDETLARIGRRHTFADTVRAFELAAGYPFSVNADIIAGLPGEGHAETTETVRRVLALGAQNITLHTLSLKRGSRLQTEGYTAEGEGTGQLLSSCYGLLSSAGYAPYYLYRQKHTSGLQENTGFMRGNAPCLYNIFHMEDVLPVAACGAGAISKNMYEHQRIERLAQPKDVKTYLEKADTLISEKNSFFGNQP